jgi:hypothetical protein
MEEKEGGCKLYSVHILFLLPSVQAGITHLWGWAQSTYFPRDETGLVCLPTQLERTLQLYW